MKYNTKEIERALDILEGPTSTKKYALAKLTELFISGRFDADEPPAEVAAPNETERQIWIATYGAARARGVSFKSAAELACDAVAMFRIRDSHGLSEPTDRAIMRELFP